MSVKMERFLVIFAIMGGLATVSSQAYADCDDAAMGRELNAKWTPQVQAAKGMCQTATATIGMLQDAKGMIGQCLVGQSRADTLAALDQKIAQWRQTYREACR